MLHSKKNSGNLHSETGVSPSRKNTKAIRLGSFLAIVLFALAVGFGTGRFASIEKGDLSGYFQPTQGLGKAEHAMEGHTSTLSYDALGGLAANDNGYAIAPVSTNFIACVNQMFRFRITGPDGGPVLNYATKGGSRMQLVVVRHDLSGYQQVTPEFDAKSGLWTASLTLRGGSVWRAVADFVIRSKENVEVPLKMGIDLNTMTNFAPNPLPPPADTRSVDGFDVHMHGELRNANQAKPAFSVTRNNAPVPIEPYLGERGHLVVLRQGDFGFLHGLGEEKKVDNETAFRLNVPSSGTYVAYLYFQANGSLHTAPFTLHV